MTQKDTKRRDPITKQQAGQHQLVHGVLQGHKIAESRILPTRDSPSHGRGQQRTRARAGLGAAVHPALGQDMGRHLIGDEAYASHVGVPVEVVEVRRDGKTTLVTVRTERALHPPLAPSSLHFEDGVTVPLDVAVATDAHTVVFNASATVHDNIAGQPAELWQWWVPDAYDAVVDVGRTWVRERPNGGHEHCLLDWEKIGRGGAEFGWRYDRQWVCEPCYDEYFIRDRLDLRRGGR